MTNKSIWYISKYAQVQNSFSSSRQFGYSRYFASKNNNDVSLIFSESNGFKNFTNKQQDLFREQFIDNVRCIRIRGKHIDLGFSLKRIISWFVFEINLFRYIIKQNKYPDIVIVSSLSLLTILNGLYLKTKGVKFILEIRDIWPLTLIEFKNMSTKNPLIWCLSKLEKIGYKHADCIIGTMPNLSEHVENVIGVNNKAKVFCIPMAYDKDIYKLNESLDKSILNKIPDNRFLVGYAGSIGHANMVSDILASVEEATIKNPKICFLILGDGPLKNQLEQSYKNKNIIFLGNCNKNQVNSFLLYCDILLHPCANNVVYKYGVSPNKWIDYMYAGKPIIASYNGYQSIINEANCGEFIEAENIKLLSEKIIEYSNKPKKELKEIGFNGRKYLLQNLSYEDQGEKYLQIICSI
jgi:glycosyltransferase involved in cell wall biosynthesis